MNRIFIFLIKFYQKTISQVLPRTCRFYPSCSEYARISLSQFSLPVALFLSLKRILRCHPFSQGGVDYPPSSVK